MNLDIAVLKKLVKQTGDFDIRLKLRLFALVLQGVCIEDACLRLKVSTSYYYFWLKRFEQFKYKIKGLQKQSTKPKHSPNKKSQGWTVNRVKYYRNKKHYGAQRIQAYLGIDHNIKISISTVSRILKKQGLVGKRKRLPNKKHIKRYELGIPGKLCQLDVKYVPYRIQGRQYYTYNLVDKASRWSFKRCYDSFGPGETKCFIDEAKRHCPFDIEVLQTDNGVEFTNKFISNPVEGAPKEHALDRWCRENNVIHKLIPVGEKELNGCVERNHRIDDVEFYSLCRGNSQQELDWLIRKWNIEHNEKRKYLPLKWKSPNQYLEFWVISVFAVYLMLQQKIAEWRIDMAA